MNVSCPRMIQRYVNDEDDDDPHDDDDRDDDPEQRNADEDHEQGGKLDATGLAQLHRQLLDKLNQNWCILDF